MLWDIFCKVIDNHGDLGVCWRLAANLAARGESVRLWVDDGAALAWMAPQSRPDIELVDWGATAPDLAPGEVAVEAFGCEPPPRFVAAMAARTAAQAVTWINLEYLTAESYAQRSHRLPSPIFSGPGKGLVRHFFYPGFTPGTGGLLRESDLVKRQASFDAPAWLRSRGITHGKAQRVSLFCYEPTALESLLRRWSGGNTPIDLLVTPGRAAQAVRTVLADRTQWGALSVRHLPWLEQNDYDHLLWACDLNFVRGEDSLVRALWAGKPLVWQIYPQDDRAHHLKLQAFLEWLAPPASCSKFHQAWNGVTAPSDLIPEPSPWHACFQLARERLLAQPDLTSQLMQFVQAVSQRPATHGLGRQGA